MLQTALAAAATLVALAFAMSTFERWLRRRRRHELAWSVALAMVCLGSGALAAGAALGWNGVTFRVFYFFGAIANVPFLALGTVYLLAGERRGDRTAAAVTLFTAFAAGVVAVAPFTAPLPAGGLARGSEVFGPLPRVLAASASGVGALVVVAGALWSTARVRSRRLALANVVIASGVIVTSASGLLNSVMDAMTGFAATLVAGLTLLFAGFLLATTDRRRPLAAKGPPGAAAKVAGQLEADGPVEAAGPVVLAGEEEELHEGRTEDEGEEQNQHDGGAPPHVAASSVTASPGRSLSSSAADRRSSATETSP